VREGPQKGADEKGGLWFKSLLYSNQVSCIEQFTVLTVDDCCDYQKEAG
jgi:hypothetical protein